MAIDKKLQIFDDEGNPVDYDILASDVKFNDGKDLPTKLAEMEEEIGEGGYTPPAGGIPKTDLAPSVQQTLDDVANKVDKETGKGLSTNDYTDADKTKLAGLPTAGQLTQQLGTKANDNAVVKSITVNGQMQTPTNGNVNIQVQAGEQVSVIQSATPDGTFTIRVGSTDYTINLNHEHQGMAKLVKVTAATLPQTMADDTIYVQVDNLTTPNEIEALHIFGLEFTGGGGVPDAPRLIRPTGLRPIDLGNTVNGSVSYPVNIKGKNLTQSLIVEFASGSTGYSFDTTDLPTGVTYDSNTGQLTITKEAACSVNGVYITVVYTGSDSDEDVEGTLGIRSSSVDGINAEVTLIANKIVVETVSGVKLTGTQYLITDYYPKTNTGFELVCRLEKNQTTDLVDNDLWRNWILCSRGNNNDRFALYSEASSAAAIYTFDICLTTAANSGRSINFGEQKSLAYPLKISYSPIGGDSSSYGVFTMQSSSTKTNTNIPKKPADNTTPLRIGCFYRASSDEFVPLTRFELTIFSLKITEGDTVVRNWTPVTRNGVAMLYDDKTDTYLGSSTSYELETVQ